MRAAQQLALVITRRNDSPVPLSSARGSSATVIILSCEFSNVRCHSAVGLHRPPRNAGMMCSANSSIWRISSSQDIIPWSKLYQNPAGDMSETRPGLRDRLWQAAARRRFRKDAGTADSDRERAAPMARAQPLIERPTSPFSRTSRRLANAAPSARPTPPSRPPHFRPQPRSSSPRQASSSRRKSLGTGRRSARRSDPGATLRRLNCREHLYLARYQKTKRFHRVPDPTDVGYNCDALAQRNMLDPDVEIVPRGTRKSRIELVV